MRSKAWKGGGWYLVWEPWKQETARSGSPWERDETVSQLTIKWRMRATIRACLCVCMCVFVCIWWKEVMGVSVVKEWWGVCIYILSYHVCITVLYSDWMFPNMLLEFCASLESCHPCHFKRWSNPAISRKILSQHKKMFVCFVCMTKQGDKMPHLYIN